LGQAVLSRPAPKRPTKPSSTTLGRVERLSAVDLVPALEQKEADFASDIILSLPLQLVLIHSLIVFIGFNLWSSMVIQLE
jgi:hypothetical protein